MEFDYVDRHNSEPSAFEMTLALVSLTVLREAGLSDAEILLRHTTSMPQADRAYETQIWRDEQVKICAGRVKQHMRRLLMN